MAEALIILLIICVGLGIGVACEHGTRPTSEMHEDDWLSEGNGR